VESDLKPNKTEQSIKNANKSETDIGKDKSKAEVSQSYYFPATGF
jgi:aminoacyl tRNA synthase complex-interacting multifunctional protein 1